MTHTATNILSSLWITRVLESFEDRNKVCVFIQDIYEIMNAIILNKFGIIDYAKQRLYIYIDMLHIENEDKSHDINITTINHVLECYISKFGQAHNALIYIYML